MENENLKKHPIQLLSIKVNELSFKRHGPDEDGEATCQIRTGKAVFDQTTDIIKCGVKCECTAEHEKGSIYTLSVEIIGIFKIDKDTFPIEQIPAWQEKNAPFILLPFLREQVYSLSIHAGIEPIILPSYTVPTTRATLQKN